MAKKEEMKQIFENMELESSEANSNLNERPQTQVQPSDIPVGDEEKLEQSLMRAEEPAGPESNELWRPLSSRLAQKITFSHRKWIATGPRDGGGDTNRMGAVFMPPAPARRSA